MDFSVLKSSVVNGRKTFRTPFKVTSMCFSPQNDLIALGSKTGEVMMKRITWKMIWKTNVGMVPAVGTVCKSESSVSAMHFSPDGRYIAAATSKGILHLLDVETGKIRYSVKVADDNITKLTWEAVLHEDFPQDMRGEYPESTESAIELGMTKPDISREEVGLVYQRLDEDGTSFKHDESQRDSLEKMFISSSSYYESLRDTILLACVDDMKITVLIAGVFPYMDIDIQETIKQYNQDLIMFYDMHFNNAFGVSFIVTTYGPFLDCKQRELKPPSKDPKMPGQGCHTLMFNVKLDIDPALWDAALRYVRLLFGYNLYSISLDTTKRNWGTQVDTLHNRFDTKMRTLKIGDVLLEMLLSGSTDVAGEAFLERGLGMDGLAGIRDFTEKHMAEVSRLARGQLATSARNLTFQRAEFMTALERSELYKKLSEDDSYLYEDELPPKETNAWLEKLEEKINILDMKTRQLGVQCLTMMQELGHLTKWISLTKPFAKSMKVNALMRIKRMDIGNILHYIVSNFFPDKEIADNINMRLFDLEKLIKTQKEKDEEEKFNELEYLEELEALAVEERKKLIETYQVKFDFAAYADDGLNMKKEVEEEVENQIEDIPTVSETMTAVDEEATGSCCDLDRVGSFFDKQLSPKALEVLPKCCEDFDDVLKNRGKRMNEESIRKIGIATALEDLANFLSNPQKMHIERDGSSKKSEISFIYEIASGAAHQGYVDVKVNNVTAYNQFTHPFVSLPGMTRSIQLTVIEKNLLNSVVLVPTCDTTFEEQRTTEVAGHIEAMNRVYTFQKVDAVGASTENSRPADPEEMEVDGELRIDVNVEPVQPDYDTLVEYNRIFPLRHGELVIVGKFASTQPETGQVSRIMRTVCSYPYYNSEHKNVFVVHTANDGKAEVSIETMIVHPTTQLTAFIHDDGTKITIGDLKPEVPNVEVDKKKTNKKTFRDYQRRRDRYREDIGVGNLTDIQYDVLVQEAMDSGRDLTGNGEPPEDNDDDY